MKNNNLIMRTAVLALCAASLMACSAKIEGGKDKGPTPPPNPPFKTSDQTQKLMITDESHTEDKSNQLLLVSPATDAMVFFFEYQPERREKLYFKPALSVSIDCDVSKIKTRFSWQEMEGGNLKKETPILGLGGSFLATPGQSLRLKVHYTGLTGCSQLADSFVISSTPVEDLQIGETTLELSKAYTIAPVDREESMYYDLKYRSVVDKNLYFSYVTDQATDDCSKDYARSMEWLTLDKNGNVIESQKLTNFSDFHSVAYSDNILRVWFKNAQSCYYTNVGFKVVEN